MKLKTLLKDLPVREVFGNRNVSVTSISDNSRKVKKGAVFVAIKGFRVDGHDFISEAIVKGARVVVGEREPSKKWLQKTTYVKVDNSRKALGLLAAALFGNPSKKLKVIGVTGTDGKTTTASLIYWMFKKAGRKVGLISTIGAKIGDLEFDTGLHVTNPEPIPLQKFLAKMIRADCDYAVLEVTSHGIDQERISGVVFDSAVLTNITKEHLDYHKNFEDYLETKARLFRYAKNFVVLNKDDESFGYILKNTNAKIISYSTRDKSSDIFAQNFVEMKEKWKFEVIQKADSYTILSPLRGGYNVSNILAAIGVVQEYGVSIDSVKKALISFKAPKGRLEAVKNKKGIEIYIDFAHTPNSLEKVLGMFRRQLDKEGEKGRLIAVFGCAGERDIKKRPMMGEISARIADVSIFTAEDPRSENVETIIRQIVNGAKKARSKEIKPDCFHVLIHGNKMGEDRHYFIRMAERGEAISFAIQKLAKKGDIIVICGKGHEKSMAYNGVEYPWSDYEAVEVALNGGIKEIKRSNP